MRRKSLWSSPATRFPCRHLQVNSWWSPALKRKEMKLSCAFVPTSNLSLIPGLFCCSWPGGILPSDCFNLSNFPGTIHWGCSLWTGGSHRKEPSWMDHCLCQWEEKAWNSCQSTGSKSKWGWMCHHFPCPGQWPSKVKQSLMWWHWCGNTPCSYQRPHAGLWIILLSVLLMLNHHCLASKIIDLLIVLSCPVLSAHLQRMFWVRASLLPVTWR